MGIGLVEVLTNLPFLGLYLVAGILAVSRWDKHPATSLLVVTSAGIALASRVAMVAMPMVLVRAGGDMELLRWGYGLAGIVSTIGLGCLVAAVFSDRDRKDGPPTSFR